MFRVRGYLAFRHEGLTDYVALPHTSQCGSNDYRVRIVRDKRLECRDGITALGIVGADQLA